MSDLGLILAALSHVGYAVAVHATPIPRWLPFRPFSCGFCLTTWFGVVWWICCVIQGLPVHQACVGIGLSILAGMLAVGLFPWAFQPERPPPS